jgi:hypothetical protein
MVAIHSVPEWDLYVVYEGTNPDTGQPIIKAFLNPLVGWIWFGLLVIAFGTIVALVPSLSPATAALRVAAAQPAATHSRVQGRRLMGAPLRLPAWVKAVEAAALVVAICFSLAAANPTSRINSLSHQVMCQCGCAQLLGECDHVGCPDRV